MAEAAGPAPTLVVPRDPDRRAAIAVRSSDEHLNELIDTGIRGSETFATLERSIRDRRGIAYVEWRIQQDTQLTGQLLDDIRKAADGTRYVRALVRRTSRPDHAIIATIGHELQHALELLDRDREGTSPRAQRPRRDWRPIGSQRGVYETGEALKVTDFVQRELVASGTRSFGSGKQLRDLECEADQRAPEVVPAKRQ